MINVLIRNLRGEYLEYQCDIEDTEQAVAYAIEQYISNKLVFGSNIFPVSEDFWKNKIKPAVEEADVLTIQDKIELLNSICRKTIFKVDKIFAGYTVEYPVTEQE